MYYVFKTGKIDGCGKWWGMGWGEEGGGWNTLFIINPQDPPGIPATLSSEELKIKVIKKRTTSTGDKKSPKRL